MKLDQVHPRLYMRGHTRKLPSEEVLAELERRDIRLVVNVTGQPDDSLRAACATVGISYQHSPLPDGRDIPKVAEELAQKVAEAMKSYAVLVHCRAGVNRSGLVAVLAIAIKERRFHRDVLADVRRIRPRVLANPHFEEYVLSKDCDCMDCSVAGAPTH